MGFVGAKGLRQNKCNLEEYVRCDIFLRTLPIFFKYGYVKPATFQSVQYHLLYLQYQQNFL